MLRARVLTRYDQLGLYGLNQRYVDNVPVIVCVKGVVSQDAVFGGVAAISFESHFSFPCTLEVFRSLAKFSKALSHRARELRQLARTEEYERNY